ncbi:MAG: BatA domain-containing protein, partial [Candidatus Cloacimonetes bacterium]|nr:BatA domain-containing protein [Candidatus Cloacimonadota bacterium]
MFSLSFLNSGLLFLAAASVIPLLIHLFARRKPQRIIFSTIRFIKESQKHRNKKISIKNLILLLLRIAIVLFTVFAISRPALKLPFLKKGTSHPRTAIALIIDNSFSMDYLVDSRTELEAAKSMAGQINRMLNSEDQLLVLTLDKAWNNLNGNVISGQIDNNLIERIEITPLPMLFSTVVAEAEEKLRSTHTPNREIYFITDNQIKPIPERTAVSLYILPTSRPQDRMNLSVGNVQPQVSLIDRAAVQTLSFELSNHSDRPFEDAILKLVVGGVTLSEQITDLEPNQKKTLSFTLRPDSTGWYSGYIEVKNERLR